MESQLAQLQTNAKMQEQLLRAKEDEVLLKWERMGGCKRRRRNETRLLDLNGSLRTKTEDLEKQVASLRHDFAPDFVGSDAIGSGVLRYPL